MTFDVTHWTLFLRAKRMDKVRRHISILERHFGRPVTLLRAERYWKDPELFDVHFTTPLHARNAAEAVFDSLLVASGLLNEWRVSGLTLYDDGRCDFTAMSSDKTRGYELIYFELLDGAAAQETGR